MEDPQARLEELVEKLREREYRITPQRLVILRILSVSDGHPSAEHIFDRIKVEFPTTSLSTVYKTIARLKEKVLVNAERCAVKGYTEICNMTAGKDHRTYELALAILNEEVEHESWFAEFLGEGPSGHGGVRREGGYSPHVSKFMT